MTDSLDLNPAAVQADDELLNELGLLNRISGAPAPMPVVVLESPYAGDVERNVNYARLAMRDCLLRGEAPFASHLLYTQPGVLADALPEDRALGISAGFTFRLFASKTVVYMDYGFSDGMRQGIEDALGNGQPVEYRSPGIARPGQITEVLMAWRRSVDTEPMTPLVDTDTALAVVARARRPEPLPHILTLTRTEDYDPDLPLWWDEAELACPYPPSPLNPCAVWTPCGCRPDPAEMHGEWETGSGPCPRSATGEHHYWEGEPQMPDPAGQCAPVLHADDPWEAAGDLDVGPGRYTVRPLFVDGRVWLYLMAWVATEMEAAR